MTTNYSSSDRCEPPGGSISVKNLQLPCGVIAPDVWGRPKEQPALVSIYLALDQGFNTAAQKDALDQNTVHYGELAKSIRASCISSQTTDDLFAIIEAVVKDMGMRTDGSFRLSRTMIEVTLPKASMSGDGVGLVSVFSYDLRGNSKNLSRIFRLENVKIMTLIGVNDYERQEEQPLVANLELYFQDGIPNIDSALFSVERKLVQSIRETSFETLESLIELATKRLESVVLEDNIACTHAKLKIEKPRAIAFADAPGVESWKMMSSANKSARGASNVNLQTARGSAESRLNIIKPYV